jgi:hypothetical protein
MSYEKHHSPSNMAIPEDESSDVKVRVVRQIAGIDSNKLQPIIRFHPDADYRVQFITIPPIDYHSVFSGSISSQSQMRKRNADTKKSQTSSSQITKHRKPPQTQPITAKTGKPIAFGVPSLDNEIETVGSELTDKNIEDDTEVFSEH